VSLVLAGTAAVGGCGAADRAGPAGRHRSRAPAASSGAPSPSPSPAGAVDLNGTLSLRDPDGYTYTLSYRVTADGFRADPTNAKPGSTDLLLDSTTSATASNTTPQRQAPGDDLGFGAWGLYPIGGAVCTAAQTPKSDFYVGGHSRVGTGGGAPRWCAVALTPNLHNYAGPLAAGASVELENGGDLMVGEHAQIIPEVPEDTAPALIDALDHPVGFVSFLTNGQNPNSYTDVTSPLTVTGGCTADLYLGAQPTPSTITAVPLRSTACPAA
jgi:hypothetical protein